MITPFIHTTLNIICPTISLGSNQHFQLSTNLDKATEMKLIVFFVVMYSIQCDQVVGGFEDISVSESAQFNVTKLCGDLGYLYQ